MDENIATNTTNSRKLKIIIAVLSVTTLLSFIAIAFLIFDQKDNVEIKEVEKVIYVEVTPTITAIPTEYSSDSDVQSIDKYISLSNDGKNIFTHPYFSLIYSQEWDIKFEDKFQTILELTRDTSSGSYKFSALIGIADEIVPCKFADSDPEYFKIVGGTSEYPIYAFSNMIEANGFHDYSTFAYEEIDTQSYKVRLVDWGVSDNGINTFSTCEKNFGDFFTAYRGGAGLFTFEIPQNYDPLIYNEMIEIIKSYKSATN